MNDEKLHLIVSNYFLSDEKANYSVKEADDMASKLLSSRDQQIALDARIDEASYWKSAIEYPVMDNVHRLPERMEKRITNLEAELATLKQAQEKK